MEDVGGWGKCQGDQGRGSHSCPSGDAKGRSRRQMYSGSRTHGT